MKIFILVVASYIPSSGSVVTFQEFESKQTCQAAQTWIQKNGHIRYAFCIEK